MGYALKIQAVSDDRSETVLVASRDWRKKANEVFDAMGHGSKTKCAKEVGCSSGFISQLLAGDIVTSEYVGPISDWLRIPRPEPDTSSPDVKEAIARYEILSPKHQRAAMRAFLAMIDSYEKDEFDDRK